MITRFLCAVVGLLFVACEAFGVWDFLHGQQGAVSYIVVGGVMVAVAAPFGPALASYLWRIGRGGASLATWMVFLLAVALVMLSAVYRTGGAADDADNARAKANRSYALAQEAKDNAAAELREARTQRDLECDGKGQKGSKCTGERKAVSEAQARYDAAVSALSAAPTTQSNPLARRIARILPVTEDQVQLYQPLMLPAALFGFGTLFLTAGLHTPRRVTMEKLRHAAPAPSQVEHLKSNPQRSKVVPIRPRNGKVAVFLTECIDPAPGARVEAGEALLAYREWCKRKGLEPVPVATFAAELDLICSRVGIRTKADGEHVYCLDVKIAS